jgi:hypothetical protein
MNTECVEKLVTEAENAAEPVKEVLEGLKDYLQLPLKAETLEALRQKVRAYSNRMDLIAMVRLKAAETRAAIESLLGDGHPQEPMGEVDQMILDDLDEHDRKQQAARNKLKGRRRTTRGKLTAGEERAP